MPWSPNQKAAAAGAAGAGIVGLIAWLLWPRTKPTSPPPPPTSEVLTAEDVYFPWLQVGAATVHGGIPGHTVVFGWSPPGTCEPPETPYVSQGVFDATGSYTAPVPSPPPGPNNSPPPPLCAAFLDPTTGAYVALIVTVVSG